MFECPLCEARYGSHWAAEECAAECRAADREARRRHSAH